MNGKSEHAFKIGVTIDFPRDCRRLAFDDSLLRTFIGRLNSIGIERIHWVYYSAGHWDTLSRTAANVAQSLKALRQPMAAACRQAHELGMEFQAIIRPYQLGSSHAVVPDQEEPGHFTGIPCIGGAHVLLDPWIVARPELRVQGRRGSAGRSKLAAPITAIGLIQKDVSPCRLGANNIEIWTSSDNLGYSRRDVELIVEESVEMCPRDIFDADGKAITRRGEPRLVLALSGFSLPDPYILVTTNLSDFEGTFRNTASEIVRASGPGQRFARITVGSHKAVWNAPRDFRHGSLEFDAGHGDFEVCLDVNNAINLCPSCAQSRWQSCRQLPIPDDESARCKDGVIAFARGMNDFLPAAPCEAYQEVRDYWMSWVGDCLLAGVDGVDLCLTSRGGWVNSPDQYGFNEPVADEYHRRHGVNPDVEAYDEALLGALRGEFLDQFLMMARRRLNAAGKRVSVHLEPDAFNSDAPLAKARMRPGRINYNWRRWLRGGLVDEVMLLAEGWTPEEILVDKTGEEMLLEADASEIPVHLGQSLWADRDPRGQADRLEYASSFRGLAGYNMADTSALYDREKVAQGELAFRDGLTEELGKAIESLESRR